jgi:predicted Ser/Thr protein kinase
LNLGDVRAAIPALEVARHHGPSKLEAELWLARAYVSVGHASEAISTLRDGIGGRPLPDTLELHFELARIYEALGKIKDAEKIDAAIDLVSPGYRARVAPHPMYSAQAPTARSAPPTFAEGTTTDASGAPPTIAEAGLPAAAAAAVAAVAASTDNGGSQDLHVALSPRYHLAKKIGSGGMGEVYLAEDEDLGRYVAIKVLRRNLATDLFLSKFRDEARIVAQLAHPNIVTVYDLGQAGGWAWIVMEFVDGKDLGSLVKPGGLDRGRLLNIIARVADAMQYAHSRGVVHRDLKPANILVGASDIAKVTDFGIAKVLSGGAETAFSAAGLQVGTVNYMAPEQIRGEAIDARTDVYLLGTTLYQCLTRTLPFSGEAAIFQKLSKDPTPPRAFVPDLTAELEACVLRCLARQPAERYQTMAELADTLRALPETRRRN